MRKFKLSILTVALLTLCGIATAQNVTVSGVVSDTKGQPIPGVGVIVDGTTRGVATDTDGRYSLSAPAEGALSFSSVGYQGKKVAINGKTVINVVLEDDATLLDETIVVAYGTATKSSFTGSATMVKADAIEAHVTSSIASTLSGAAPGVQVISSTGDPASGGSLSSVRIRGIGSMSASNAPLVILDGMPYDGAISDVNPNDVESISVLKDAAASAIYGARGANGVIIITTKRASSRDAVVRFDAKFGSNSRLIPQYDVITDPGEYYETHYRQMFNSQYYAGSSVTAAYAFADANLFDEKNGGLGYQVFTVPAGEKLIGTNFKLNPNATLGYSDGEYYYTPDDWYDEVFHNSFRQEYNVSVSGSGDRFNYYASFGFLDDGGVVDNSRYKRYTGRINADYQAKKWLKVLTSASLSHSDSEIPSYSSTYGSSGNIFYVTNNIAPIYPLYVRTPVYDANGVLTGGEKVYENGYPLYDSNNTNFIRASMTGNAVRSNTFNTEQQYADVLTGKIGALITPVAGLTLTANLGVFADNTRLSSLSSVFAGDTTDGTAFVGSYRTFTVNNQYLAEYKKSFGLHNIDVLAGYEQYTYKYQTNTGQNDHLFNPYIAELNNADGSKSKQLSSYTTNYMTMGILSRVQYDYDGKYFLSASYRRDASSRFAKKNRWGTFGSIGAAWLISKEDFLKDVSWIDMLKFKASWGVQGNDNLGSYFPYTDQYTHSYNADTGEYSVSLSYKGNEDLTWESNHSINAGFDFEFFKGRLGGTIEAFSRITSDLLYNKDVPLSSGNPLGYMPVNVGSISNTGVELALNGVLVRKKNFNWDVNLNLTSYKNKILKLDETVREDGIKGSNRIYREGGSLYEAYVRKFAGVNQETGKAQWYYDTVDAEGNTVTDITETFSKASQYDIGSILPKLFGGFGTTLRAYGFDLSAQFSFQLGGKYYDGTYQGLMHTSNGVGNAWHKDVLKSWTAENPSNKFPRLDGDESVGQTAVDNYFVSSNFLSVNNVTLGYTLPSKVTEKFAVAALRVYVAGENLGVLTARKGIDPRYSFGIGGMTSGSGLNSGSYSAMRNITAGVTVTF